MTMMLQVREKEEAWRKYKDAVEEGKTAGVHRGTNTDIFEGNTTMQ